MPLSIKTYGSVELITDANIPVPHGFTSRVGGVSEGCFSGLNLGAHRGDKPECVEENYRRLADALGFSLENLVPAHQTHSDIVRAVDKDSCLGSISHRDYPVCDALITNTPGIALLVFTADCTPILFYDPVTGAVGAAHAGWRGTAAGIAAKTVAAMVSHYGCKPENIRAAIGPNISACCFETDEDVPGAMLAALGEEAQKSIRQADQKYYVNLKELNALWLRRSGVTQITVSDDCTACQSLRFWSHRRHGDRRGSQGGIIVCREGLK